MDDDKLFNLYLVSLVVLLVAVIPLYWIFPDQYQVSVRLSNQTEDGLVKYYIVKDGVVVKSGYAVLNNGKATIPYRGKTLIADEGKVNRYKIVDYVPAVFNLLLVYLILSSILTIAVVIKTSYFGLFILWFLAFLAVIVIGITLALTHTMINIIPLS